MEYTFEFFKPVKGRAAGISVSFANYGVALGIGATEAMGRPQYVSFGYDQKNKLVAIKPVDEDNCDKIEYISKIKGGLVRLSNKALVKILEQKLDIKFAGRSIRYSAQWDSKLRMLIVDMKKPISKGGN